MEAQINHYMQLFFPAAGYALYNFSFIILFISQVYGLNIKKTKSNVELAYILSFGYQIVALFFLMVPGVEATGMTISYLFIGMIIGSIPAKKEKNPTKYFISELVHIITSIKRDLILAPIRFLKNKLIELEAKFYPEPKEEAKFDC